MKFSLTFKVFAAVLLCALLCPSTLSSGRAAEPSERFLSELRARGYYDMALLYLAQARTNPRVDDDWKKTITYEEGVTLLESAATIGNRGLRFKRLDDGQNKIKQFVAENPGHVKAIGASGKLADALAYRGAALVHEANLPAAGAKKDAMLKEARGYYQQALQMLLDTEKALFAILNDKKRFPPGLKAAAPAFALRADLRKQVVNTKFNGAKIAYLIAATAEKGSDEHKKYLIAAAERYQKLGEKFRVHGLWGLYARQREGVCFQEAGEHKKALVALNLIMLQADDPRPLMVMKIQTLPYVLKSYRALEAFKMEEFKTAATTAQKYVKSYRGRAAGNPDALELRYALALLFRAMAVKAEEKNDSRNNLEASKLALEGMKYPGPRQKDFIELLKKLGKDVQIAKEDDGPPTFAELMEQAREAREKWQQAMQDVEAAKKENPPAVAGLLAKVAEEKTKTLGLYNHALRSIDPETKITQITYAQTALAYVHLVSGEYYETAVIGEFVARSFPASGSATSAAGYALIAYKAMYSEAVQADSTTPKTFEAGHVVSLASYIIKQWPESSQASRAFDAVIDFSIRLRKMDEAVAFLEKLETNNPARATAEIKIGQAYWYQHGRERSKAAEDQPSEDELTAMVEKAKTQLENGIAHLGAERQVDSRIARAVMYLARIHLDTGEAEKSIKLLEDEKLGALGLIKAKHEVSKDAKFVTDAYRLSLRAYVSAKPPQLKKAEGVLDSLEALTKNDPAGDQKLTNALIGIAVELKKQIEILPADKKQEKARILKGFEFFLGRIAARGGGKLSFPVYNWMANTWFTLAERGQGDRQEPNEDDLRRYNEAITAYKTILSKIDEFKVDEKNVLKSNFHLAMCYKKIGNYDEATKLLVEILKTKVALSLQIEAARIYQERAERSGDADYYTRAIRGGEKNAKTGKNIVWGWNLLSKKLVGLRRKPNTAYNEVFHVARYNAAVCWFKYAQTFKGEKRAKNLQKALRSLANTRIHAPELGGEAWKGKYERLQQEIEEAQ